MKNALKVFLLLAVASLFVALFTTRYSGATTVTNMKVIPGSSCRVIAASYPWVRDPETIINPLSTEQEGWPFLITPTGSVGNGMPPHPATDSYEVSCPIHRDNPSDPNGLTTVSVDVVNGGAGSSNKFDCWVNECTAPNATTGVSYCFAGTHNVITFSSFNGAIRTLGLALPTPGAPGGTTWKNAGYANVNCIMTVGGDFYDVRYGEVGANSFDW